MIVGTTSSSWGLREDIFSFVRLFGVSWVWSDGKVDEKDEAKKKVVMMVMMVMLQTLGKGGTEV